MNPHCPAVQHVLQLKDSFMLNTCAARASCCGLLWSSMQSPVADCRC